MAFATGDRVGRYELGQKLGQGGFGVIYVARDAELGRDVAIKLLRPEHVIRPEIVQRFLQEARAAARIQHPGIVTVHDSGLAHGAGSPHDETVYITMELLAGETLSARISRLGRLPTDLALGLCRQMASALAAAHGAGIVHRDLKPANVFLVPDRAVVGGERVKILDFGIAKLADGLGDSVQTHSLVMLGTPMYMSPEQCKSSAKVDARSDVYALGCILFQMLSGRPPFDGDSGELIAKHQLIAAPRLRSLAPGVASELDLLVDGMLAKAPEQRPQSMDAVIDTIDAIDAMARVTDAPAPARAPGQTTLEGADTVSETQARPDDANRRRGRLALLAGAALAIAVGVLGALLVVGDDATPATTAATTPLGTTASAQAGSAPAGRGGDAPGSGRAAPEGPALPAAASLDDDQRLIACRQHTVDRAWARCTSCLEGLPSDAARALRAQCDDEAQAQVRFERLRATSDPAVAHQALAQIAETSVYWREAADLVDALERRADDSEGDAGPSRAGAGRSTSSPRTASKPPPATKQASGSTRTTRPASRSTSAASPAAPAPTGCDAEKLKDVAQQQQGAGQHAAALASYEAALRCRDSETTRRLAVMAACNAGAAGKAKTHFARLSPALGAPLRGICFRKRIVLD